MSDIAERYLNGPAATVALGKELSNLVTMGDTLLLEGQIGAGKSLLARSLIQTAMATKGRTVEDVPSPTFTLVQSYDLGDLQILHADLYRLQEPSEAEELGLLDAIGRDLVLIEWPDRLGGLAPRESLSIELSLPSGSSDSRIATMRASAESGWEPRLRGIANG